jgi:hypothetical protein
MSKPTVQRAVLSATAALSVARVGRGRRTPLWIACTLATLLASGSAHADTNTPLPKGYTSDELPALPPSHPGGETDPSALTDFREPLAQHGTWIEHETYGTVWVPANAEVGDDFAPYQTAGHWEMTDEGEWLWVSYYDWGYIPFHYGRWVWISGTGWAWIPGRVYAPAWVVWRVGYAGYIGWAPMPPAYYWDGGFAVALWVVPPAAFVFCPTTYVYYHDVHHYVVHDHATVRVAAAGTRNYKPASPGGGTAPRAYRPAQPSLGDAGISPRSAEKARGQHDARARAYARRSTTPGGSGARDFRASPSPAPDGSRSFGGPPTMRGTPGTPRGAAPGPDSYHHFPRSEPGPAPHGLPSRPSPGYAPRPAHPGGATTPGSPPRYQPGPSGPSGAPAKKVVPAKPAPKPVPKKKIGPARSSPGIPSAGGPPRPSAPRPPPQGLKRR